MTIPDWAHYVGMNDRFAALGPRSAAKWKERLAYTLQHCLHKPLHAEMFAQDFAVDHDFDVRLPTPPDRQSAHSRTPPVCAHVLMWCRVQVILLQDFVFFRVRSDGSIPRGDDILPGLEKAREMVRQRREELRVAAQVARP